MTTNVWKKKDTKALDDIMSKPKFTVRATNEENVSEITIFDTDEYGKKIKITRRIKKYKKKMKVNLAVLEREKWERFGIAATGKYMSYEDGTTFDIKTIEENLPFIRVKKTQKLERDKIIEEIIRKFGNDDDDDEVGGVVGPGGAYVAPSLRNRFGPQQQDPPEEENKTIRISNLSEMHTEEALYNLTKKIIEDFRRSMFIKRSKVADVMKDKLEGLVAKLTRKEKEIKKQEEVANMLKKLWKEETERKNKERMKKKEEAKVDNNKEKEKEKESNKEKENNKEKSGGKKEDEKKKDEKNVGKKVVKNVYLREKKPETLEQKYGKAKDEWKRLGESYHELEGELKETKKKYKILIDEIEDRQDNLEIVHQRDCIRRIVVNYDRRDDGYYAFINFERRDDAVGFYENTREYVLDGLVLKVDWAKPRRYYPNPHHRK